MECSNGCRPANYSTHPPSPDLPTYLVEPIEHQNADRIEMITSWTSDLPKVGSQGQHIPTVDRIKDVREVARLMFSSDGKTLPVFDIMRAEAHGFSPVSYP